jgi:hypothetical protein
MPLPNPYLYILARNDLASLNPGKLAAQAAHAANVCQTVITDGRMAGSKRGDKLAELWKIWAGDRGFGTTITLEVPATILDQIKEENGSHLFNWEDKRPLVFGVAHDPGYPVCDGSITHLVPLTACGFVFGDKNTMAVKSLTSGFKLYP